MIKVKAYSEAMDWARLKEGLRIAMHISADCNKFVTDNEIWSATADPERRRVVISILLNCIRLLGGL